MPREWKDITIDENLNYEGAQTAEIARYDRIMQHRTNEAMNGLANRLDQAIDTMKFAGIAQGKQQSAMIWLTIALVFCTIAYTLTNIFSVLELSKSNDIQGRVAEAAMIQAAVAQKSIELQKNSSPASTQKIISIKK